MISSVRDFDLVVLRKRAPTTGIRLRIGIPARSSCFVIRDQSAQNNRRAVRRGHGCANITCRNIRNRIAIDGGGASKLSIFCKISSETSFSELISGTTSSCSATFLNWIFDCCARPVLMMPPPVADWIVLTGTGISVPEAMIAFLLLVVKTVGREITLSLPVDSSACTMAEGNCRQRYKHWCRGRPQFEESDKSQSDPAGIKNSRNHRRSRREEAESRSASGSGTPVLREMPTTFLPYFAK